MNLSYKILIEFLIKNEKEFRNLINTLNEKYDLNIDSSELDKAFEALNSIEDQSVSIDADGSSAVEQAETVEQEIGEIPDEHETELKASSGNLLADLAHVSLAWDGMLRIIGQVKGVIDDLVETYGVQERADQKLMSSLREANALIGDNYNLLKDQASAIQKITEVGDEESQMLMSLALNMGVSFDKVTEVTKEAIGLAKSFEAVGLSQETAMKGLALAYEGDFNQLQRYIPALKTAKTDTEKLTIVQEAAAKGFRQATDEAATTTGQMKQMSNQVGDLKEQLGENLAPAVLVVTKGFLELTKKVMDFLKLTDFAGDDEKTSRMLKYRQQMKDKTLEELEAEQRLIQGRMIGIGQTMHYINSKEKMTEADREFGKKLSDENQILHENQQTILKLIEGKKKAVEEVVETGETIVFSTEEQLQKLHELQAKYNMLATADKTEQKVLQLEIEKDAAIAEAEAVNASQQLIAQIIQYYSDKKLEIYDQEAADAQAAREEEYNKRQEELGKQEDLIFRFRQKQLKYNNENVEADLNSIDHYYETQREKLLEAGISEKEIVEQIEREKYEVKRRYNQDAISLTSSTLKNLATASKTFGKAGFEAWKAVSIAQAIVDTYAAANAAYKAMAGIPIIGPVLGATAAAAAIGTGITNVTQIRKTKYKAEKGRVFHGPRHHDGGIEVEVEDEEMILNRNVYKNPVYRKIVSVINEATGGIPLAETSGDGSIMASGGVAKSDNTLYKILNEIMVLLKSFKYPEKIIIEDNRTGRVIWKSMLEAKAAYERANK